MFITKRHIPRRTFLRGAGVTLALPLLEAMLPATTALAQTAANSKSRFVGIFFPHGMAPGYWAPEKEGALPEKLPYILASLENLKNQTLVEVGGASRGHDRVRSLGRGGIPDGHQTQKDSRIRCDGRESDYRSDHRAEDRSGNLVAVASIGRRRPQFELQQLR